MMRIKIGKVQGKQCLEVIESSSNVRIANSWARIKLTAPLLVFDKENSIEFLLNLLYYIYNYYCGYAPCLPQSSCPSGDFFVICHDFIVTWPFCDSVTSHMIFPVLHLSNNLKEKKRKRNINNDLAILPSHDKFPFDFVYYLYILI